jgi:hypothetical protein
MEQSILSWSYREGSLRTYLESLIKSGYTIVTVIPMEYREPGNVLLEAFIVVNR